MSYRPESYRKFSEFKEPLNSPAAFFKKYREALKTAEMSDLRRTMLKVTALGIEAHRPTKLLRTLGVTAEVQPPKKGDSHVVLALTYNGDTRNIALNHNQPPLEIWAMLLKAILEEL